MNPGRFYIPTMGNSLGPVMSASFLPSRGGFFGRITNSLRGFNWSSLLNGANKTLNVVNQTIPLVRQAGPMFNNMKSMLRIARAFGSETTNNNSNIRKNNISSNNVLNKNSDNILVDKTSVIKKETSNNNYPNFFV